MLSLASAPSEASSCFMRAVVAMVSGAVGRGPTNAHATYTGDVVCVVLRDTHTKVERTLIDHGRSDTVHATRLACYQTFHDELRRRAEELFHRAVLTVQVAHSTEPDLSTFLIVLERPARRSREGDETADAAPIAA